MYNFELEKPRSVADAVAAMAQEDAQALGGGQTLIPTLKQRLASPAVLVSLSEIAEMKGIRRDGGLLCIAERQHTQRLHPVLLAIRRWQHWPAISAIRQCVTAAPLADLWPTMIRLRVIRRQRWAVVQPLLPIPAK